MARTRVEPKKAAKRVKKTSAEERTLPLPMPLEKPGLTVRGPMWNDGELYLHREDLLLLELVQTKVLSGYQGIGIRRGASERIALDFDRALCTSCHAKKTEHEKALNTGNAELAILTAESKANEESLRVVKRALNAAYNFDLDSGITYDNETGRIRFHGEPVVITKETSNAGT